MLNSPLLSPLFSDAKVAQQFSAEQFIAYMLEVEAALATVQEKLGIIPSGTAERIKQAVSEFDVDLERLQTSIERQGIPTIDLIKQLREKVGGESASYVHWGATTQDIMDTASILQLRAVSQEIEPRLFDLIQNLTKLADKHRHTLMAGRSHSQQAIPITFGFKVANWISPLVRHYQRLNELKPRLFVVQFGGAVGTLASLDEDGIKVRDALAEELDLGIALTTWHTQRDNLIEFAGWLSLLTGSLAKIAQDIILMAQSEIAELRESSDPNRGGSSTMPQKHNPVISEVIIAAARTNASLLSNMHHAMIQEHERATGAWQMEWISLPQMLILTAAALNKALFLSENLVVNTDKMRVNVKASNGLMLAEALDLALAKHIGRTQAKAIVKSCVPVVLAENRHLVDVVREQVDIDLDWGALKDEMNYTGASQTFIDTVLNAVANLDHVASGQ